MAHDINDRRDVLTAEQRAKRREMAKVETLRAVMDTPDGRTVMRGVIGLGDVMSSGYVQGGKEADRHQAYLAGRRSVAVDLLAEINLHVPELGELMMREGHAAEKREREEDEAAEIDAADDESEQEHDNG